jgi:FkbM family methyltransferase
MKINIRERLRGYYKRLTAKPYYITYSQSGEDLILATACDLLHIKTPTYLDIGAHDPCKLSNTYHFYQKGSSGVLIEPNPALISKLRAKRPRDTVRQCGIGPVPLPDAKFYILSSSLLSTFSESEAVAAASNSDINIIGTIAAPVLTLEQIIAEHFLDGPPTIISMDVEGLDKSIIGAHDWENIRPPLLCVETREFAMDGSGRRIADLSQILLSADYDIFGLTYYNTVFIDRRVFAFS